MYQALFHKISVSCANLLIVKIGKILEKIKNPSDNEREALLEGRSFKYYKNQKHRLELYQYYTEYINKNDIWNIFDFERSGFRGIKKNGITVLADTSSKYYNVVNNCRITVDIPKKYHNSIYMFGNCNAVGCFAEDKYTIASILQEKYNDISPDTVRVVNAANWTNFEKTCRQILSPLYTFKKNDSVVIVTHDVEQDKCNNALIYMQDKNFYAYCDLSNVFDRPHKYGEILFDQTHMTHNGYSIVARHLFDILTKLKDKKESQQPYAPQSLAPYMKYLSMLKRKRGSIDGTIGSIVMNCNPFTLGHKHLVTEAMKRCDYLYIFILDVDKSFFKFDDRISMAKLGLKDFANVSVVPGGKTIISLETMPEYFDKDSIQDVKIDASYDLGLFSLLIAPALDIVKRFAGQEPFCQITRQYNDGMRTILPQHGIEFVELPRYAVDGHQVSASRVRECIKNKEHESLKNLVPSTTYNYLIEKQYLKTR